MLIATERKRSIRGSVVVARNTLNVESKVRILPPEPAPLVIVAARGFGKAEGRDRTPGGAPAGKAHVGRATLL